MKFILLVVLLITPISATLFFDYNQPSLCLLPSVAFRDRSTSAWNVYTQGWYYGQSPIQSSLFWNPLGFIFGTIFSLTSLLSCVKTAPTYQNLCYKGFGQSTCARSDANGCIQNKFLLTDQQIQPYRQSGGNGNIYSFPASISNQNVQTSADVHFSDDYGYTCITAVDNTIVSGGTSSAQISGNSVGNSFVQIAGMANVYQRWQTQYNPTFAYMSAAPDQSYPCLRDFFNSAKFPKGSCHMRHFTSQDSNWNSFCASPDYVLKKQQTILMFLQNTFRTLILVDNYFQTDLSFYVNIYAQYPDRIGKICIRKYASDTAGQLQLQRLFASIPQDKWMTFETGADLPTNIC